MSVTGPDKIGRGISDVLNNGMTTRAAARIHDVPRSIALHKKELEMTQGECQFMKNFDPANSKHSCKKQTTWPNNGSQRMYDCEGRLLSTGLDLCDCLMPNCVGCFFACPKCRSCKCGHECRKNRKWTYDYYQVEGTSVVINHYEGATD